MSLPIFPSINPGAYGIRGLGWPIKKTPEFSNLTHLATSGKEFRQSFWTYPRWHYELTYNYLKDMPDDLYEENIYTDLRTIEGFYLSQLGSFGPFWFFDPSDNNVALQQIGVGDGETTAFQLVSNFGGFIYPVQAPFGTILIYLNGVLQSSSTYTIGPTGIVTFGTAIPDLVVITGTYSYYFTCRFEEDMMDYENFMYQLWSCKSTKIYSLKL